MDHSEEHKEATKKSVTENIDEGSSAFAKCHEKAFESWRHAQMNKYEENKMEDISQTQPDHMTKRKADGSLRKSNQDDQSHEPVPSVLSMKSDRSKGLPENFRGDFTPDFTHNRDDQTHEPVPSVLSMKSDRSKGLPENFRGDFTPDFTHIPDDKPHKPVPSVLSMKSDRSKGLPENFRGDFSQDFTQIQLDQPDSSSSVSEITSHISADWMSSRQYPVGTPECVHCDVCSKKAVKSCLTCIASFCEPHVKLHYTAPALQRHKLVEATANLEQRLCQHHNKVLDLFCQTDNIPVCALCSVEKHKRHEIIPNKADQDITQVLHIEEQEWIITEDIPPPGPIKVTSVKPDFVSLSWEPPEGLTGPQRFRVSVKCTRDQRSLEVQCSKIDIQGLSPQVEYECMVATICGQGNQSTWVSEYICTEVPVPKSLAVNTTATSIRVTWSQLHGLEQASYLVTLKKSDEYLQTIFTEALEFTFCRLQPATKYTIEAITVLKNGCQSESAVFGCNTVIPVPENLQVDSVTTTTANLSWSLAEEMDQVPHNFEIYYDTVRCDGSFETIYTDCCRAVLTGLKPYRENYISVFTNVENLGRSQQSCICIFTGVAPVKDLTLQLFSTRVKLEWDHPNRPMGDHACDYLISYHSDGSDLESFTTSYLFASITNLKPNKKYTVSVSGVVIKDRRKGDPVTATFLTGLPPPASIQFTSMTTDSVSLNWGLPEGLTSLPQFRVSVRPFTVEPQGLPKYHRRPAYAVTKRAVTEDPICMVVQCLKACFDGLVPGKKYTFSVATLNETGLAGPCVSATAQTDIPGPVDFNIHLEDLLCTWQQPVGVSGESYKLGIFRLGNCFKTICTTSLTCTLSDLDFETEYTIKISTSLDSGCQSKPLSRTVYIDTPVPEDLNVDSVSATSAELSWRLRPVMEQIPHNFLISFQSEGTEPETISTDSYNTTITSLKPDTEYMVSVCTIIQRGEKSRPVTTIIHTDPPAPGPIKFSSVSSDSLCLTWGAPEGPKVLQKFRVLYTEKISAKAYNFLVPCQNFCAGGLMPGEEYKFSVATVSESGRQSSTVLASTCTEIPVPTDVNVDLDGSSAKVSWSKPDGLDEVSYMLTFCSSGEPEQIIYTKSLCCLFPEHQHDTECNVSISSVLPNGRQSKPVQMKPQVVCHPSIFRFFSYEVRSCSIL